MKSGFAANPLLFGMWRIHSNNVDLELLRHLICSVDAEGEELCLLGVSSG